MLGAGITQSLRAGRSGDRIPVGGEIYRTRPDLPWGPPSLMYSEYRVSPGGKADGAWSWPTTPSSAEVKERVELYLYFMWAFVACSRVNCTFMDSCLPTSTHIVTESRAAKGGRLQHVADLHKDKVVFRV
jgi:hypothetical protein